MQRSSEPRRWQHRAVIFGLMPCLVGIGGAQLLRWNDVVWLTDVGGFWPYTLSAISAAILIKLARSPFAEPTSSVAGWLTLLLTWFYVPLWATAVMVPATAAVVGRDGRAHFAREPTRQADGPVWLLTDQTGVRTVHNVAGRLTVADLELVFTYAASFIAVRPDGADLRVPLEDAAGSVLTQVAKGSRTSRIAFIESRQAKQDLLARICRRAVGDVTVCPLQLSVAPVPEAVAPGGVWSTQYTVDEAIADKHLPSLVRLLTQPDASLTLRDQAFALFLDLVDNGMPLAQLIRDSHLLDGEQFDVLIGRVLEADDGDLAAAVIGVNRLNETQRKSLRQRALDKASISTIVDNAAAMRITDSEVAGLAPRMRATLLAEPAVAVRVLHIFGDRLPRDTQRDAVDGIVRARAMYALSAITGLDFAPELRQELLRKIVAEATPEDFARVHLSREKLLQSLTPPELRALIAMAVARSETSEKWHDFVIEILPVRNMTQAERRTVLNAMLFKSPKIALEFVSKNKEHLEPADIREVTRDYTRTVTREFCLHLSHRNKNWRTNYFSAEQLQIFRDCAEGR